MKQSNTKKKILIWTVIIIPILGIIPAYNVFFKPKEKQELKPSIDASNKITIDSSSLTNSDVTIGDKTITTNNQSYKNTTIVIEEKKITKLKLVDLSIKDTIEGFTLFDFKLINSGQIPAFIKKVEIIVLSCDSLKSLISPLTDYKEFSYVYDAEIPAKRFTTVIQTSQTVTIDNPDRFGINIHLPQRYNQSLLFYLADIKFRLYFNDKNEFIETPIVTSLLKTKSFERANPTNIRCFIEDNTKYEGITRDSKYNRILLEAAKKRKTIKSQNLIKILNSL
jgi:hypothetical protein